MRRLVLAGMLFSNLVSLPAGAAEFVVTKTADTLDGACDAQRGVDRGVAAKLTESALSAA